MVIQLAERNDHVKIVLSAYRKILRNSIFLKFSNSDLIVHKIRREFRKNKNAVNSIEIQRMLNNLIDLNNSFIDYHNHKKTDAILYEKKILDLYNSNMPPYKRITYETNVVNEPVKEINENVNETIISIKSSKNPMYKSAGMTDDEISEYKSTREITLPGFTKKFQSNSQVNIRWYYKTKGIQIKGKLDDKYLRNVLPSLISFEKQKYELDKILKKLSNDKSSSKIRRISGTKNWIYLINTPWNKDLRTCDHSWIKKIREHYDSLILKTQEYEKCKNQMMKWSIEEDKWEKILQQNYNDGSLKKYNNHNEWLWSFETCDNLLQLEADKIENEVILFNKKQGIIFDKIKPLFDQMDKNSKKNASILINYLKESQSGPYTDTIDGGLGKIMQEHGFKSL